MNYDAVVFDMDGTLTDSEPGIIKCLHYAFDKLGLPVPEHQVLRKFLGPPLVESFISFCGMNEEEAVRATGIYRERYGTKGWKENAVYPGIRSLLRALHHAGRYLSVATGKPHEASDRILRAFDLHEHFNALAGPMPHEHFADKKDLIIRSLNGFTGRGVMIGDRASDIIAARELGMDSIGVLWGYGSREELEEARPDYLVQSVGELYDILGVAPEPVSRGYFISLEGNDGCGKSTQAKLLHEWLIALDYDVVMTREPGGSKVAEKIRALVLDRENIGMQDMTEALLYAASRAQHVRDVILPALAAGKIVLSDRYVDSSIAYQGAGRELGMDLVARINAPAIDGCLPDLTVLLDIDAAAALRRREKASEVDRIEMMEDSFHVRVGKAYQELLKQNPGRIIRVDAQGSEEKVADRVSALVSQRLKEAGIA